MKPNFRKVLSMALEEGVRYGYNRAHKHVENPHEQEEPQLDWYCEEYDLCKERIEHLQQIKSELARLQRYDDELSSVMPEDYKDWWQNSKEEWPEVAKGSIENLREREELAWKQLEAQQ